MLGEKYSILKMDGIKGSGYKELMDLTANSYDDILYEASVIVFIRYRVSPAEVFFSFSKSAGAFVSKVEV